MTLTSPHVTSDSFFHLSPSPSPADPWPITIYLISGNPGLISYYHTFLSLLSKKLAAGSHSSSDSTEKDAFHFHIAGHSLAGFELEPEAESEASAAKENDEEHYYDLEEQIRFVQERLEQHMHGLSSTSISSPGHDAARSRPKVILIGHSVGSYMAMEILRRHRERRDSDNDSTFDIVGGVMLFPTVKDIAKSPSGQKLTVSAGGLASLLSFPGLFIL